MAQIAKDTGLGRESLYKAFRPNAKPRFDTVMKVINSLQIQFLATPRLSVRATCKSPRKQVIK